MSALPRKRRVNAEFSDDHFSLTRHIAPDEAAKKAGPGTICEDDRLLHPVNVNMEVSGPKLPPAGQHSVVQSAMMVGWQKLRPSASVNPPGSSSSPGPASAYVAANLRNSRIWSTAPL